MEQEKIQLQVDQMDRADGRKNNQKIYLKNHQDIESELQGQSMSLSDCTVCHTLNHNELNQRRPRRVLLLARKIARVQFIKIYVDKLQSFWEMFLELMRENWSILASCAFLIIV